MPTLLWFADFSVGLESEAIINLLFQTLFSRLYGQQTALEEMVSHLEHKEGLFTVQYDKDNDKPSGGKGQTLLTIINIWVSKH